MTFGVGTSLDELAALEGRDPGRMLERVADFPPQLAAAWDIADELAVGDAARGATAVAVLGMGGSAIAGDIVRGIYADRLRVPLLNVRDYDLPAWADRKTLVVAVSHSGATEETISALSTALERRCPVAVITTGGPLGDVARRVDLPRLIYPDQSAPRAALGYTLVLLTRLLERAGMLDFARHELDEAIEAVQGVVHACRPQAPTESNPAKQLAWSLLDRLPVVEASGFLAPVAYRWKTQLNENAKSLAVAEQLPEATHNTVVGYDQPDTLRDHLYVVFLASSSDHPRNSLRATLSTELLAAVGISYQVVPVGGEGRLAQACSAIVLGDYVSTYLALLYGVDPTPVEAIAHVKSRLLSRDVEGDDD
ncbi:MAG: bifunctional phosphoglucose/phosphomannose isomerase [Chloroflexota bacterium]|nr:bifunctional phosphoglucose/phosphomannose isomerase [Chloroflexota bacterium]